MAELSGILSKADELGIHRGHIVLHGTDKAKISLDALNGKAQRLFADTIKDLSDNSVAILEF